MADKQKLTLGPGDQSARETSLQPSEEQLPPQESPESESQGNQIHAQTQANLGQPFVGHPYQWVPIPWYHGQFPGASSSGNIGAGGGLPANYGANPTTGMEQTGGFSGSGTYPGFYNTNQGANPFPYQVFAASGRPEPGDPLYTTNADGPELKIINQQLKGAENYSGWSREFRRALVTKDKDVFIDGTLPVPSDERMARIWRKCNQLVRTWIGNCITADVAAGLPPTEDAKQMWDNIREMYGKLDQVKIFNLTQQISELK